MLNYPTYTTNLDCCEYSLGKMKWENSFILFGSKIA